MRGAKFGVKAAKHVRGQLLFLDVPYGPSVGSARNVDNSWREEITAIDSPPRDACSYQRRAKCSFG